MVENLNKLEAAFLAGRIDATAERKGEVPEGVEDLLRMILSDGDRSSLARLSKMLFRGMIESRSPRIPVPTTPLPSLAVLEGGSNGTNGRSKG